MNRIVRGAVAMAFACAFASPALALDLPKASRADHRVRYVNYEPSNVIQLDAVIGVATLIVLEPDETYEFHVFGDSEAYDFTHYENNLFFKPMVELADTNLIVITNKRNYTFRLTYHSDRSAKALYKLQMRYPDSEMLQAREQQREEALQTAFNSVGLPVNWQSYSMSGNMELAPVHAWDDGSQTWFQFPRGAEIPVIYRVSPDGQEVLTNYHMADSRTMVLHRTAARWHVRLGGLVLAIYNDNFGSTPAAPSTGTASPSVQRVVTGAEPQRLPVVPSTVVREVIQ